VFESVSGENLICQVIRQCIPDTGPGDCSEKSEFHGLNASPPKREMIGYLDCL